MNCIGVHKTFNQIMTMFHGVGLWHRGEKPTDKEKGLKIFFTIFYFLFPIALIFGGIENEATDQSIFLVQLSIMISVAFNKMFYIIWKKEEIVELLNRICVHIIDDCAEFIHVNDKLNRFMTFVKCWLVASTITGLSITFAPLFSSGRTLFIEIGFPLDWRNNDFAYWLAFSFIFLEAILSTFSLTFSALAWYLMYNCGLNYDILGNRIKNMGVNKKFNATGIEENKSEIGENIYHADLIEAIRFHRRTRDDAQQMSSFLSVLFLAQLAISSLCICGSIYRLIFNVSEDVIGYIINVGVLLYSFFEILMVMYFGNEIKSSSDRLKYCLFESNWLEQLESDKKLLRIFGEILQQPHVLIVGKLYSLTLQTFSRILNSAYSMLNILAQYV